MSGDWDATLVTPGGEEIEPGSDAHMVDNATGAHRDPDELRRLYHDDGMTIGEIADHVGVAKQAVRGQMLRHDIERRGDHPRPGVEQSTHAEEVAYPEPDGDDGHVRVCPDCGTLRSGRAEQQTCLRMHARKRADRLQCHVDDGVIDDALAVEGVGR